LQQKIDQAASGAIIYLAPGTYQRDVNPNTGTFTIINPLSIRRCGTGEVVLRSIGSSRSVLRIVDAGSVTLEGLTITTISTGTNDGSKGLEVFKNTTNTGTSPNVLLKDCLVKDNTAVGIYCDGYDAGKVATVRLEGTTVSGNVTTEGVSAGDVKFPAYGGGVYANFCTLELTDSDITNNVAGMGSDNAGTGDFQGIGGGIYMTHSQLDLKQNSAISGNIAHAEGVVTISNNPVSIVGQGGGIFINTEETTESLRSKIVIEAGSTVTGNEAKGAVGGSAGEGGGIYVYKGSQALAAGSSIASGSVSSNLPAGSQCVGVTCT